MRVWLQFRHHLLDFCKLSLIRGSGRGTIRLAWQARLRSESDDPAANLLRNSGQRPTQLMTAAGALQNVWQEDGNKPETTGSRIDVVLENPKN